MDTDKDETLANFQAITENYDVDQAKNFLQDANWDLMVSLTLYNPYLQKAVEAFEAQRQAI
jgi:hypothetical protein